MKRRITCARLGAQGFRETFSLFAVNPVTFQYTVIDSELLDSPDIKVNKFNIFLACCSQCYVQFYW